MDSWIFLNILYAWYIFFVFNLLVDGFVSVIVNTKEYAQ